MRKMLMKMPIPRKFFERLFPILKWSKKYDSTAAIGDLIAGVTIALTLIPQSIAYASLAGLEPQYGLYASYVGGFIYAIMGTCPQINIGPTALLALLTFAYTTDKNPDFAVLLCFMGGVVQLVAGITQLGLLVEYVSMPVVSGFTSAAAITIASSQLKDMLGLDFRAETLVQTWKGVFNNIEHTKVGDTLLSIACCIVLLAMKAVKDIPIKKKSGEAAHRRRKRIKRYLWFFSVSRNAVVVIVAAVLAFFIRVNDHEPLSLTGPITPGVPMPAPPPFETVDNNIKYSTADMLSQLGVGIFVVPFVGIISNVAIAKSFARRKVLDATQEIIALGVCNVISAFFHSLPVNGSFSRSAVSESSGVKTTAAGFYTGIIVILTLLLFTPCFSYIPRAALSAVIVCAVLTMVDWAVVKKIWSRNKLDVVPLAGTFISCLALGIEKGLAIGVAIDVLMLTWYQARPPLHIEYINNKIVPPYYKIRPSGGLYFAGAEYVRSKIMALKPPDAVARAANTSVEDPEETVPAHVNMVVYCDMIHRIDYTFLQWIKVLVRELSSSVNVIWCDASPVIQKQLTAALKRATFCEKANLMTYLKRPPGADAEAEDAP